MIRVGKKCPNCEHYTFIDTGLRLENGLPLYYCQRCGHREAPKLMRKHLYRIIPTFSTMFGK